LPVVVAPHEYRPSVVLRVHAFSCKGGNAEAYASHFRIKRMELVLLFRNLGIVTQEEHDRGGGGGRRRMIDDQ
jgi:hypothetical protein